MGHRNAHWVVRRLATQWWP